MDPAYMEAFKMRKLALLSFFALFISAPAVATISAAADGFLPAKGLNLDAGFGAQHDAILKALGDGETYRELADEDVQVVKDSLGRISHLLGDVENVNLLPESTRVRVFSEQEKVNTLLVRAHAESRMVCRREKPIGSHRPVNSCLTVGERRRAREAVADFLRYNPRAMGDDPNNL